MPCNSARRPIHPPPAIQFPCVAPGGCVLFPSDLGWWSWVGRVNLLPSCIIICSSSTHNENLKRILIEYSSVILVGCHSWWQIRLIVILLMTLQFKKKIFSFKNSTMVLDPSSIIRKYIIFLSHIFADITDIENDNFWLWIENKIYFKAIFL